MRVRPKDQAVGVPQPKPAALYVDRQSDYCDADEAFHGNEISSIIRYFCAKVKRCAYHSDIDYSHKGIARSRPNRFPEPK